MSHADYFRPSGQFAPEMVMGPSDWQRIDVLQSKLIDGDNGGTWAAVKPIIIGGSGVNVTAGGGIFSAAAQTLNGGRLVLGSSEFVVLSPTRTDSVLLALLHPSISTGVAGAANTGALDADYFNLTTSPQPIGTQSAVASGLAFDIPRRYLHNGASLVSMVLTFTVVTNPGGALPAQQPFFGPLILDSTGTAVAFNPGPASTLSRWQATHAYALNSYVVPNATANGFYFKATSISGTGTSGGSEPVWPTTIGNTVTDNPGANQIVWTCQGFSGQVAAATPAAYYNGGLAQSVTYTFDGTTTIDTTANRYAIAVNAADASTTDPTQNVILHSLLINMGGIVDTRFE